MLEIGVNSYIDVEYADNYIDSYFNTTDKIAVAWNALTDEQKEMLLFESALQIDNIRFTGKRMYEGQIMAFPRIKHQQQQNIAPDFITGITENVRLAQIKNTIAMLRTDENAQSMERLRNQREGVTSFSLANYSESYGKQLSDEVLMLADSTVLLLLKPWLGGGFMITR